MAQTFDINTDELVKFTNNLEKVNKLAMPNAVKATINEAAFEAKTRHVEKVFTNQFTIRKKYFIKSHTAFNKTKSKNVNSMKSDMGVIKGKSDAGDELILQEFGGTVQKREYIPTKQSRVSRSLNKLVSKPNYRNKLKPVNKKPIKKHDDFKRAAYYFGKKAVILFNKTLVQIKSLSKKGIVKYKNLYSYEAGRSINLSKKEFIKPSGILASKNMTNNYFKFGKQQINKYLK